jgi:hypothetical protein
VRVSVRRMRRFGAVTARNFEIELAASGKPAGKS